MHVKRGNRFGRLILPALALAAAGCNTQGSRESDVRPGPTETLNAGSIERTVGSTATNTGPTTADAAKDNGAGVVGPSTAPGPGDVSTSAGVRP